MDELILVVCILALTGAGLIQTVRLDRVQRRLAEFDVNLAGYSLIRVADMSVLLDGRDLPCFLDVGGETVEVVGTLEGDGLIVRKGWKFYGRPGSVGTYGLEDRDEGM